MSTNHLIILFVVLPMAAGILTLLLHKMRSVQRTLGLAFLLAELVFAGVILMTTLSGADAAYAGADWTMHANHVLTSQMGNWPAPFGITVVVDPMSAIMLMITSVVCLSVFIYCIGQLGDLEGGYFHPLYHLLIFGVQWSFITGDLFNLFVAFEIMLMASYAIFVIGTSAKQMRQAYKYVLLNLTGSTLFVACAGLLYGQVGTLNMADLTRIAMAGELPQEAIPIVCLLLIVFGGKAAVFPLWFWLPDSYHTLPAPLVGLFAGLLTKVGAYVSIRVFVMIFGSMPVADVAGLTTPLSEVLLPIVLVIAAVTMFLGVLGAVSMHTVRRILAIHIISQVGYMVMGIGLGMIAVGLLANAAEVKTLTDIRILGVAGAIFFIIHNMVVKCCLFLCGGLMQAHAGSDDLESIGGLVKRTPWLAVLFIIAALSLAGLPPLSGFFGKFALIKAGWQAADHVGSQFYWVVGFAIATSLLTLLSMLKIWSYGFWEPPKGLQVERPDRKPRVVGGMIGIVLLVVAALSMGLGAQGYMNASMKAARSVVDPQPYVAAVLGEAAIEHIKSKRDAIAEKAREGEGTRVANAAAAMEVNP